MEADSRKQKQRNAPPEIKVVVIEHHHHALEHIHEALRRQRRLGLSWSLCHIDAHPDLGCPSNGIPAAACFRPNDEWSIHGGETQQTGSLYELFDTSTTGISEWILPMVMAADLTFVEWVKPCTKQITSQFPLGWHKFYVGAHEEEGGTTSSDETGKQTDSTRKASISSFLDLSANAFVKVDWDCLYYRDDQDVDFFAPSHLLHLPKQLGLLVTEWSSLTSTTATTPERFPKEQPWILDICLDYFVCINPFLADIEKLDKELARVTYNIVCLSSSYAAEKQSTPFDREKLLEFRLILKKVFQRLVNAQDTLVLKGVIQKMVQEDLAPFIGDQRQAAKEALRKWKTLLTTHEPRERSKLVDLIMESLPHIMLPHTQLESNVTIQEHISTSLANFEYGLRRRLEGVPQSPFLITVARSMHDGFTPEDCADDLQNRVKTILHKCLCNNDCEDSGSDESSCRLRFMYDYETTAQETNDTQ